MDTSTNSDATMSKVSTQPALTRLDDAIREIVREEIQRPAPQSNESSLKPTKRDAFWLVLIVTNAALLIALVPEDILTNSKLGLLLRFVPWLGSSLFVLGYTWFRDQIVSLTRRKTFEVAQIFLLVVLGLLTISQMNIFTIYPVVEPANAKLIIDGIQARTDHAGPIQLSFQTHNITVIDENDVDNGKAHQRDFTMTFSDVFRAWRNPKAGPRWSLAYWIPLHVEQSIDQIEIRKEDSSFDSAYWSSLPPARSGREVNRGKDSTMLIFRWDAKLDTDSLRLPYGKYRMIASKCGKQDEQLADVNDQTITEIQGAKQVEQQVEFQKKLCP